MTHEIIFREQYGTLGEKIVYIKPPGGFLMFVLDDWIQEEKYKACSLNYIHFSVAVSIMKVLYDVVFVL
jgi:hypothetical protein